MTTNVQNTGSEKSIGAFGFSSVAVLFTGTAAYLSILFFNLPLPSLEELFVNVAIFGYAIFYPYGLFYTYETKVAVEQLMDLGQKIKNRDDEAARKFALLTIRSKKEWPESYYELVDRTLHIRAKTYMIIALILFVIVGVWVGQETVRQGGNVVLEWNSIDWQWP